MISATDQPGWRRYFEATADRYDEEAFTHATAEEAAQLWELLELRPGARLLDLGCGTGRHAVALAERGAEVTGVDLSPAMLARARARAADAGVALTLVEADARALPPGLGPFDAAICLCEGALCLVPEHVEPLAYDQAVLSTLHDHLRPGGGVVLSGLNAAWLLAAWQRGEAAGEVDLLTLTETSRYPLPDGGSIELREHYHLPEGLRTLAERVGFEVAAVWAGGATSWRREPATVDDQELLLVGRRPAASAPAWSPEAPGAPGPRAETRLTTLGRGEHAPGQPLNVPIVAASSFRAPDQGLGAREYSRNDASPGWEALEELLGDLEGGRAVCFASGMAAIAAVLELLPVGARVVVPRDSYGGVRGLLAADAAPERWRVTTVDMTDTDRLLTAVDDADLVWLESPSNPLLEVVDIAEVARRAHAAGASVVVDNTFATPLLQSPLRLGADLVVHSATKFIGGHADLLLGVVVTRDDHAHTRLVGRRTLAGATPGALECFLALRGARTLALRLRAAQDSAGELARRLQAHPKVHRVRYPGLPGDPFHLLASRQMAGFGAIVSFELADAAAADAVCVAVRTITHATSLGGVESTIERRAKLPGQQHVPAGLLRLSVGCEHLEDLWTDLDQALGRTP